MKKRLLFLFMIGLSFSLYAQPNITRIEYFIDADPGRGGGTSIFVSSPTIDQLENITTGSLTEGFHLLTVRAQDALGIWGLPESKVFYVTTSTAASVNNISTLEYFIDIDPGRGLGVDIPITASTSLDILENVPTATLVEGFHLLTIRAQEVNGNWSLSESKPFYVTQSTTLAPNMISAMEYFIDADPGRGLGVDIPITAATSLDILENVPTATLVEGFHLLTIRAQDVNGNWSLSESKPFYVTQSTALVLNTISAMEYYIDADPGRGLGVDIPIAAATSLDILENVPTATLAEGFHLLTLRAQDNNGNWSLSESKPFYVTQSTTLAPNTISAMEYFIDIDPGRGLGVAIPITAAVSLDILENVPTSTMTEGFHLLTIRAQDDNGNWSLSESKPFYVTQSSTINSNNISALEYFIDADPGQGMGTSITITPNDTLDIVENIPTTTLSTGMHILSIRGLDDQGNWSFVESKAFYVDRARQIINIEHAIDTDPGIGLAVQNPIIPATDSTDVTLFIPTASLSLGPHNIVVRTQDEYQFWSKTTIVPFTVCDGGTPDFTANLVCEGSATTFTDISLNVQVGDTYSWDFDGDGFEDSNIQGDQSFTFTAPGTYYAKLSIDRSGCIGVDSIAVVVEASPVANAGVDQTLCTTAAVLSGNPLNANEVGTWSVFSGSAVVVDPADPVSDVNSIADNSIELIWEVNNTLGGCSAYDTVMINANLPITARRQTNSVDIGQSSIADVQSIASVNPSDVLTTTISTIPLYGIASVLPVGTIDYLPDLDAPALDSVQYRITNQCFNFSENYVVFNVGNAPPEVQSTLPSPQVGTVNVTIDISNFISDPNNNIDYSSLTIITQPISGAIASIDGNNNLTIDYSAITYRGDDVIEIRVCDLSGICVNQLITIPGIDVGGENPPITVYNGVSPDGDGHNDYLEIENIEFYPDNTVIILNRWGAEIERIISYNNQDRAFKNNSLPSGTYYYHILPGGGNSSPITGHFLLHTNN